MYPKQFLLQIREITGVLDPKFDSNLQGNLTRSQNSVIWPLIYGIWSAKNNFCISAIVECQRIFKNGFFRTSDPNIPCFILDPKNPFLWIWSSNGWLLLEVIHCFWNIMHHVIIGLKLGTKSLAELVSGNYP